MMNLTFAEEKLRLRIDQLASLRYRQRISLDQWYVCEDVQKTEKYPPKEPGTQEFFIGDRWSGRDFYLWVQKTVDIPAYDNPLFLFDFGKTGVGYNSGFESLLFLNGAPYQGVDTNHQEAFISKEYRGQQVEVALKLWSGLEGGGPEQTMSYIFKNAELVDLDEATDELYYLADVVQKTIVELDANDPLRYALLDLLNRSFLVIDWLEPGSKTFYQSVEAANALLQDGIQQMDKNATVAVTAVGHTHIDVAWLWRLKHTREKAARSFSTVLRLMEQYPEYVFLQTQPQLYKYMKEDYPEIYKKIKQRVAEGRWEVDGAMWLESDCNIPSGESLTRQILHGAKFVKEEFGKEMHYLWLPDVFGYSWALPQILRKSGIDTFMTTKISWNQFNRMPHDTFIWKGIDGSEVLTHFVTTPEPKANQNLNEWSYTYNGQLEPETVRGIYHSYRDKDFNDNLLLSYGYGDGGGGVTRDMLEKRRYMDQLPGLPSLKTGTAKDYFEKLHETVAQTDHYVHKWDGELYLEYHRGTYTSQAFVKKMNRKTELMLRELEFLYSLNEMNGGTYPQKELFDQWEVLLRNQFHDIIPGSSIKEVYQDHKLEFAKVWESLHDLQSKLNDSSGTLQVINTSGWTRQTLVSLPTTEEADYLLADQYKLDSVIVDNQTYLLLPEIKGLSQITLARTAPTASEEADPVGKVGETSLETPFYVICWNDQGHLVSIFDKENQREVLQGTGNVFQVFEDKPMQYDAWDLDIFYQEKYCELTNEAIKVKANNQLFVDIALVARTGQSTITQTMRLYRHTRRIDFLTKVDWQERQRLLKVKFDVAIRATEATYDIQYGNVKRPTHWNTSWDMAKFETVGHQWADLSERSYGVSLLNDCKYGYDIKEHTMRLSLLKGAIFPDPTADLGQHEFVYSLLPHRGDFVTGKTIEEAWEINQPLTILESKEAWLPEIVLPENASIAVDALKKAEDGNGWILRIHENHGATQAITLGLAENMRWHRTNLLEKAETNPQQGDIQLTMTPYELVSLRIVPE